MRRLILPLGLLLLVACAGDDEYAYVSTSVFSRIAPEDLEEHGVFERGPDEDPTGLYVRYERESRVTLPEGVPSEDFVARLAASVDEDLRDRGFEATVQSNERNIVFVKFMGKARTGTVFIRANAEDGRTIRLVFRINETLEP